MVFNNMLEAREHYEKLRQKNYDDFQQTGEERYNDAAYRYDMIVTAMDAYLESKNEEDLRRRRRHNNFRAYIENQLYDKHRTYTRDDVVRILQKVEGF